MDELVKEINGRWPWLNQAMVSLKGEMWPVPLWLKVCCLAGEASGERPVVMVLPGYSTAAPFTALLTALQRLKESFPDLATRAAGGAPQVGERVMILPEKRVYTYEGLDSNGRVRLRCPKGGGLLIERLSPLRIKPCKSGGVAGQLHSIMRQPLAHPVVELLGCDPMGNADVFPRNVALIDSIGGTARFLDSVVIAPQTAKAGSSSSANHIRDFDPNGLLLTVHRHAQDFLSERPAGQQTVIINGARRLDGLTELGRLLREHRVLVFCSTLELDRLDQLREHADFWYLEDDMWLTESGDTVSTAIRRFARGRWSPRAVSCSAVEGAAGQLVEFCTLLAEADQSPAHDLARPAWRLLLDAAIRVRGYNEKQCKAWAAQIAKLRGLAAQKRTWLTAAMQNSLDHALDYLLAAANGFAGRSHPKERVLWDLVGGEGALAIITRSENEAISIRDRFRNQASAPQVYTTASLPEGAPFDRVVLCGWLGARLMEGIFASGLASTITLIAYEFELAWLKSMVARFQRRGGFTAIDGALKLEILGVDIDSQAWPASAPRMVIEWPEIRRPIQLVASETEGRAAINFGEIDIWDFEFQMENRRKTPHPTKTGPAAVEEHLEVLYVSFAGPGFALLSPERRFWVVTGQMQPGVADLEQKRAGALKSGDLVVFSGPTNSDLVSGIVDRALKSQADRLRTAADQYRLQLSRSKISPQEFLAQAKKKGMSRSLATIRQWFEGQRVIGPEDDDDIRIIQQVVGGSSWAEQCIEARRQLKQAHEAARSRLRLAVMAKLESRLEEVELEGCRLDLGELGVVDIQCVDTIAEKTEQQPKSRVNRLMGIS